MPEPKNIKPSMARAHGLRVTRLVPKIPIIPRISPIIPITVSETPIILLVILLKSLVSNDSFNRIINN